MSLTVQQLIADAKKLSTRLMDRDQSADQLISRGQDVLKEVEAMRQYEENIENLNEIAHQRPRAHLVLGIQQENRHIRSLQQENKELRAALEEHQAALELIMSKYRQHISRMIKSTGKIEYSPDNLTKQLHDKSMKVYEMAAVMKEAVRREEDNEGQQKELIARLYTENKGLRELLDISRRNRSQGTEKKVPPVITKSEVSCQTDTQITDRVDLEVTLPMPAPPPRHNRGSQNTPQVARGTPDSDAKANISVDSECTTPTSPDCETNSLSASESDETSDDDSVKYDTIKLRRKNIGQHSDEAKVNESDNTSNDDKISAVTHTDTEEHLNTLNNNNAAGSEDVADSSHDDNKVDIPQNTNPTTTADDVEEEIINVGPISEESNSDANTTLMAAPSPSPPVKEDDVVTSAPQQQQQGGAATSAPPAVTNCESIVYDIVTESMSTPPR